MSLMISFIYPFNCRYLLYPRQTKFEGGILGISVLSVGPLQILRRELLPQFLTNSHEIWHSCLPWGVVYVRDTFFNSGRMCVAMVTAYYGKQLGGNLASRTTSSVFDKFSWNLAQMFALGCRCARHIFGQLQKVRCHGNGILWQEIEGRPCVANYCSFWTIVMEFGTDVCLGV